MKGVHILAVLVFAMALSVKAYVDVDEFDIPPPPTPKPPKICTINKCGNPLVKYYRDPADPSCHHFCQCSNGTPYRFICPANLKFHPVKHVCVWPQDAIPCERSETILSFLQTVHRILQKNSLPVIRYPIFPCFQNLKLCLH
jgi:hypothetical protein